MTALIVNGVTYTKGTIAAMKQRQMDAAKMANAPSFKGMSNGKTANVATPHKTHAQRKANIVARSIENDPKKNSGFHMGRAVK